MTEIEWEEKLEEVQKHSEHWYDMYKKLEKENEVFRSRNAQLKEQIEEIRKILCEYSCLDDLTKNYIASVIKEIE